MSRIESLTAKDGTVFTINSEHVRGEPRYYFLEVKRPGDVKFARDSVHDGAYRRDKVERLLHRRVEEYERVCIALGRNAGSERRDS